MQIKVYGQASEKCFELGDISELDMSLSVLEFLLKRGLPVAFSCKGQKVCKKCLINKDVLSCALTLKEYIQKYGDTLSISYI